MPQIFTTLRLLYRLHLDRSTKNSALGHVHDVDFLQRAGISQGYVVDLERNPLVRRKLLLSLQHGLGNVVRRSEDMAAVQQAALVHILRRTQGLAQNNGDTASARAQVDVPRAQRKTIGFPRGGADDNFGGHHKVLDHALDDDSLLDVLLAKVDAVRLDNVEQLHADGGDAAEKGRSAGALEDLCHGRDDDEAALAINLLAREARRVHLGRDGRKDGRDAAEVCAVVGELAVQLGQGGNVALPGDGVGRQVLLDAELGRVDVYAHDDVVVLARGGSDQGEVALVQGAHGGHEADGAVVGHVRLAPLPHGVDEAEDLDGRRGDGFGDGAKRAKRADGVWTANGARQAGSAGHEPRE